MSSAVAERPNREALSLVGKRIDEIRKGYEAAYKQAGNEYERSCILACSLIDLRLAVKQYMPVLKQLQGSKLGFRTDKDREGRGYDENVVIDCAIEAVMRGARWTGNEFNILAGGCYLTKEYWWRAVTEIEGLTDLDLNPGIPEFVNQKCVVEFAASWKLDGKACSMVRRIPILVRGSQSDDATLGKAEARMLKAIHKKITGTEITDAGDDEPVAQKAAAPPSGTRPAVANKVKCDGDHGAPACGDPECWQLDPPDEEEGSPIDWSGDAKGETGEAARTPSGGRA